MKSFKPLGYFFWMFSLTAFGLRLFLNIPNASLDKRGVAVWIDIFLALILYLYINLTGISIGKRISKHFYRYIHFTEAEKWILSHILGLLILGITIFSIGLAGLLTERWVFILLALVGLYTCVDWPEIIKTLINLFRKLPKPRLQFSYEFILSLIALSLLISTGLIALMPVWDYDALMYHLTIPAKFLEVGRIYFEPSMYRSANPLLGEMLFIPGIILHLESTAKLISLTYACLFVGSVYCFGKRFFTIEIALLAIGILLGNLGAPVWASSASIDFAWATYEFWSIYAIMLWLADKDKPSYHWLILAGIMSGFAGSTKYLAVPPIAILVLLLAWKSFERKKSFKETCLSLLMFGGTAALIMSPWYIKNWLWTGNPVYPLVFGGSNWDAISASSFSELTSSFGIGHHWMALPLLPYYLYAHPGWFGDPRLAIVHPALWFAAGSPFLAKWRKYNILIIYMILDLFFWLTGIQIIRYLLPLTALVAIISASVIASFPMFYKKLLGFVLIVSMASIAFFYQYNQIIQDKLSGYFVGYQSTSDILEKKVNNYVMTTFIEENLMSTDKVLFLWDARAYYCANRCIGDHEQSLALRLSLNNPSPTLVAKQLRADGITHIMLNRWEANWFILSHDPFTRHKKALEYFEEVFLSKCGKTIYSYSNGGQELFKLSCP